jgi:hypothetical protein
MPSLISVAEARFVHYDRRLFALSHREVAAQATASIADLLAPLPPVGIARHATHPARRRRSAR